jgi:hypothetical protein
MTTAFTPGPPGPANPRPGGPTGPRPSGPSTPAPTRALAAIDALLAEAIGLAADRLPAPVDQLEDCGHAILLFRLQVARKAWSPSPRLRPAGIRSVPRLGLTRSLHPAGRADTPRPACTRPGRPPPLPPLRRRSGPGARQRPARTPSRCPSRRSSRSAWPGSAEVGRPHKPRPPSKPPRKPINTAPIRARR